MKIRRAKKKKVGERWIWDKNAPLDILNRGIELLQTGQIKVDDSCPAYCCACTLTQARQELDKERGTEMSSMTAALYMFSQHPWDRPFIAALKLTKRAAEGEKTRGLPKIAVVRILMKAKELFLCSAEHQLLKTQ